MASITRTEMAREKRIACASMVQIIWTSSGKRSQPNPRSMVAERTMQPIIQGEDSGRERVDLGRSGCPRERECSVIPGSMTTAFVSAVQGIDREGLKRQSRLEVLRPSARDLTPCNAVSEEAAPQHFPQPPKDTEGPPMHTPGDDHLHPAQGRGSRSGSPRRHNPHPGERKRSLSPDRSAFLACLEPHRQLRSSDAPP
ncbi:hypothetical protein GFGA_2d0088 (plasmid) [Gluconobacter frateurii NBRC 103465]|nr:hypothetical protein GFGA_2d0088 [Gluconobacter frateurii NBRC 103465]